MYRVFIVGTGFSKPAGLPLGKELWKLVIDEAKSEQNFYELLEFDIYWFDLKIHDFFSQKS